MATKKAPTFKLQDQNDNTISLVDFKGKWLILYFYPKDNTPGCSTEAIDFTTFKTKFKRAGADIIGISGDSVQSHNNFSQKKSLKITLLSDPEKKVIKKYGVWQLKKNYGKEYFGIVRSTFIINPEGKIVYSWEKVKVKEHVENVITKLKELQKEK